MRVAYVCADSGVPVFGTKGCSIHVQEIIRAFLRRGDTVDLFVARVGGDTPADLRECGLYQFPVRQVEDGAGREAALQQNAARLAEVLPLDQYDLIYERYSLWSSAAIRRAATSTSPTVLEVNAPLIQEQQTYRRLDDVHRANQIATEAFHLAGSVVAVSTETAEYVRTVCRDASGFSPNHVHVIPNGVDVNRFRPAKLPESDPAEVTIGFVGSLKPWHGVD
ncbi:MAG: glycosyltransferase, partial [Planctomycetaceae bacterium]|nr:glycosyltransferase [Planctomycetaceae bacterium]